MDENYLPNVRGNREVFKPRDHALYKGREIEILEIHKKVEPVMVVIRHVERLRLKYKVNLDSLEYLPRTLWRV